MSVQIHWINLCKFPWLLLKKKPSVHFWTGNSIKSNWGTSASNSRRMNENLCKNRTMGQQLHPVAQDNPLKSVAAKKRSDRAAICVDWLRRQGDETDIVSHLMTSTATPMTIWPVCTLPWRSWIEWIISRSDTVHYPLFTCSHRCHMFNWIPFNLNNFETIQRMQIVCKWVDRSWTALSEVFWVQLDRSTPSSANGRREGGGWGWRHCRSPRFREIAAQRLTLRSRAQNQSCSPSKDLSDAFNQNQI